MSCELFDAEVMASRPRYQEHSREVFNATLGAAVVEEEWLLSIRHKVDSELPYYFDDQEKFIAVIKVTVDAIFDTGFAHPVADYEIGGFGDPIVDLSLAIFDPEKVISKSF